MTQQSQPSGRLFDIEKEVTATRLEDALVIVLGNRDLCDLKDPPVGSDDSTVDLPVVPLRAIANTDSHCGHPSHGISLPRTLVSWEELA